jgi:hypothetical protein
MEPVARTNSETKEQGLVVAESYDGGTERFKNAKTFHADADVG